MGAIHTGQIPDLTDIELRRWWNQICIEALTKGRNSGCCGTIEIDCQAVPIDKHDGHRILCDRCIHKHSMDRNPDSTFIGYEEVNTFYRWKNANVIAFEKLTQIEQRKVLNQHNIDCYILGKASKLCGQRTSLVSCSDLEDAHLIPCNRCDIREDIAANPNSAFIGYTPQILGNNNE